MEPVVTEEFEIASKEVQGVQDKAKEDTVLTVFPAIEVKKYPIHIDPNSGSLVLYEASEDEEFKVIDEIENWYRIELPDGQTGWLSKSKVKSQTLEER
jgi:SH3-like domain-containing protein